MAGVRSRRWVFTINNYSEEEELFCKEICPDRARYVVFGREVGEAGTPHLQGYLELDSAYRRSAVLELLGGHCFCDPARGTAEQASTYAKKEGDWFEAGQTQTQGSRTDLQRVADAISAGWSLRRIGTEFPVQFIRYGRGIRDLYCLLSPPRDREVEPDVTCFWGKTGSGKTRKVWDLCAAGGHELWVHPGGKWFDGYSNHTHALFDDMPNGISYNLLLLILDRNPILCEVKGSHVNFCAQTIFLTSNVHPREWYPTEVNCDALLRRLNIIRMD